MSDVDEIIERHFRELVLEVRYRSITVTDLCERAGISRKTFYVHFSDKDDIVERIFCRDVVKPMRDIVMLLSNDEIRALSRSIHERMFQAVYDDRTYYRALIAPMHGNDLTFVNLASSVLYDFYRNALTRLSPSKSSSENDYVASYFASAQAMTIEKWVCDGFPLAPAQIAGIYDDLALSYWKRLTAESAARRR